MFTLTDRGREAQHEVDRAARSRPMEALARLGLVGKGIIHLLIAVLAVDVALGNGGDTEDKSGALQTVAEKPFGEALVVVLAVLFAGYAVWRLAQTVVGTREDGAKDWAKRAGYAARGATYAFLAVVAIQIVASAGGSGGGGDEDALTARVLDWPAGRWLVIAAGLAVIGAAAYVAYAGLTRKFREHWRTERMSEKEERVACILGQVGNVARAVTFALIGLFLVKAAWEYDPQETVGLDGALATLAQQPYGPWLLGIVAVGLGCYGAFCIAEARWRDVEPEGGDEAAASR